MKILVAGGTGFIGSHLVPALVAAGHHVIAVVRPGATAPRPAGAEVIEADLAKLDSAALPAVEAVVHLAQANLPFPEHASDLLAVNCASAVALAAHAVRCGAARFLYASSGSVYGTSASMLTEESSLAGTGFYAQTKIAAERLLSEFRGRLAVDLLRLFTPYGPGQQPFRLVPDIVARVREGRAVSVRANGMPSLTPIAVADVVRVLLARLQSAEGATMNVCGTEVTGIREIAETAGSILGRAPAFDENPSPLAEGIAADASRMISLTGVRPVGIREGLAALCAAP